MSESLPFEPDWAVPPGATIAALLEALSLSREALATQLGANVEKVQRLMLGLEEVDGDLAGRLSRCLGPSKRFWVNREAQYRADVERGRRLQVQASRAAWIKQFPVKEMADLGWIGPSDSPAQAAERCLKFFGVPDVAAWQSRFGATLGAAAFRMSASATASPGAVSAWLRWAELVAGRTPCSPWNPVAFRDSLTAIRRLTWYAKPSAFLPRLRHICASAGGGSRGRAYPEGLSRQRCNPLRVTDESDGRPELPLPVGRPVLVHVLPRGRPPPAARPGRAVP